MRGLGSLQFRLSLERNLVRMKINLEHREGTRWRGSPALVMALALVCFSIFAWGLRYKLSLYNAGQQLHPTVTAAKLLSPKQSASFVSQSQKTLGPGVPLHWTLFSAGDSAPVIRLGSLAILNFSIRGPLGAARWRTTQLYSKPPPASL